MAAATRREYLAAAIAAWETVGVARAQAHWRTKQIDIDFGDSLTSIEREGEWE